MDTINAIAKVRFATSKPQRVQLHKGSALSADLLCMEAGQSLKVDRGEWVYYAVMGTAELSADGQTAQVSAGHLAAFAATEAHTVRNAGEGRLVCLAIRPTQ